MDAGLLKHFSNGAVRGVLAGFQNAGDGGPCLVVGAFDQQHVLIANDNCGNTWQPQWCVSDVPTKLDDEGGDRHIKCLTPDRDQDTSAFTDQRCDRAFEAAKTLVSCSARFRQGPIDEQVDERGTEVVIQRTAENNGMRTDRLPASRVFAVASGAVE